MLMVGICFGSLALLAGTLGLFGLTWYTGKQNGRRQKKIIREKEQHINELTTQ
jgi:hypothetical protein